MTEITAYHLRQISIPKPFYIRIKNYCKTHKITMIKLYHQILDWFFFTHKYNLQFVLYRASYREEQKLSLWIHNTHIKQIKLFANKAHVSEARVVFTALMMYLEKFPI